MNLEAPGRLRTPQSQQFDRLLGSPQADERTTSALCFFKERIHLPDHRSGCPKTALLWQGAISTCAGCF